MGVLNDYANAAAVNAALNKGVEASKAVSELKEDLSKLYNSFTAEKTSSGGATYEYDLIVGKTYYATNNGSSRIAVCIDVDGQSTILKDKVQSGEEVEFSVNNNGKLRIYFYGSSSVLVYSGGFPDTVKRVEYIENTVDVLSNSIGDLNRKTDIVSWVDNKYIKDNVSVGTIINISEAEVSSSYFKCLLIPVLSGESYLITGAGGTEPRLWCLLDESYKVLSVSNAELSVQNLKIDITQNGWLIINTNRNLSNSVSKVTLVSAETRFEEIDDKFKSYEFKKITGFVEVTGYYYNCGNGSIYSTANNFSCTNMIKVKSGDVLKVTTSAGESVGVAGYDINKNYNSRILEVGGSAIYPVARGVVTTEIVIPENVEYITVSNVAHDSTEIIIETNNLALSTFEKPKIVVVPNNSDSFAVMIISESGGYLKHLFRRQYYSDVLSYGDNLTKDVVGADIWYSPSIYDEKLQIAAGNFNFIHNISNHVGHNGYVGAGHGCTVMDWCIFKADGTNFIPANASNMIECSEFSFDIKAKHYLIDKPNSPSESHAVPTLDESGNPIVTSINIINAIMKPNNEIEHRNRLIFKMDNIQFSECHGAMCEAYFDAVDNVIISNYEESWNEIDTQNDYARIKKNGTNLDVFTAGSKKALSVTMFGEKYKITEQLVQMDGARNKKTNTRSALYRDNGARMKIYIMPVVCTISAENIASGETVETFNTGDILDVVAKRKITTS